MQVGQKRARVESELNGSRPARTPTARLGPNPLGYACICTALRKRHVFMSRTCRKKTLEEKGASVVGDLAVLNCTDLIAILKWNEANGIRFFRLSSDIFPWKTEHDIRSDPRWSEIQALLRAEPRAPSHVPPGSFRQAGVPGPQVRRDLQARSGGPQPDF
jgi:UV DNA damage endonuclease